MNGVQCWQLQKTPNLHLVSNNFLAGSRQLSPGCSLVGAVNSVQLIKPHPVPSSVAGPTDRVPLFVSNSIQLSVGSQKPRAWLPTSISGRKNCPLTGRNLEQDQAQMGGPSWWRTDGERRRRRVEVDFRGLQLPSIWLGWEGMVPSGSRSLLLTVTLSNRCLRRPFWWTPTAPWRPGPTPPRTHTTSGTAWTKTLRALISWTWPSGRSSKKSPVVMWMSLFTVRVLLGQPRAAGRSLVHSLIQ